MASTLYHRATGRHVGAHDHITDKLGRAWGFWLASVNGVVGGDPVIIVRRVLPDNSLARRTSDFAPDFFPDYTFDAPQEAVQ